MNEHKPIYPFKQILTLEKLGLLLGVSVDLLRHVSQAADKYYRPGAKTVKKEKVRETIKAIDELYRLQGSIKEKLLDKVLYPAYLMGGIRKRDYLLNAKQHIGASIVINLDIANFFPSCCSEKIYDIWRHFFKFSKAVSRCLTLLTTSNNALPQGVSTSAQLANLVFFNAEHLVVTAFKFRGLIYTRYIDDFSISAQRKMSKEESAHIVSEIYKMLSSYGLRINRKKLTISAAKDRMEVNKVGIGSGYIFPLKEKYENGGKEVQVDFDIEDSIVNVKNKKKDFTLIKQKGNLLAIAYDVTDKKAGKKILELVPWPIEITKPINTIEKKD